MSKLLLVVALGAASAMAAGTTSLSSSPSATVSSQFPPSTDTEDTGAIAGGVGASGGQDAGNSGPTEGAFTLSKGAIIGISVAAGIIVLAIVALWALWFTAKREQLTIKEQLKRASRRMTGRKVPPTPRQMQMNRRHATMYGPDVEKGKGGSSKPKSSRTKAQVSEKSSSRSTSPDTDKRPIKPGRR